ncbi:hypothetical protein ACFXHA_17715 [Nocardia sp. NPDC059240]|uniref:hypothetical protein n=1 Tax=Nocardia sp. NPDC059240 TaxID=3346786 RepID=UPI00367D2F35
MKAFGFILRAASGENVRLDEDAMMREAARLGFSWSATFFEDDRREGNYIRMVSRIMREGVDAVFLPAVDHMSEQDIEVMATHCDVYCLAEGRRHPRAVGDRSA